MKKIKIIAIVCAMFTTFNSNAQKNETKKIKEIITAFSKAGDQNNIKKLSFYLDDNYRIVMNQLFGSKKVAVISKSIYLEKIKSKEWGGDTRTAIIENIIVNGNTSVAKVTFKGKKATFISLINLVKNAKGEWKLISDTPVM